MKEFVDGDSLVTILADIDLDAASSAVRKASLAEDRRNQLWSAINHLEQREAKLLKLCDGRARLFLRPIQWYEISDQVRYNRCLMALIYAYLDERDLAKDAVDGIEGELDRRSEMSDGQRAFLAIWNFAAFGVATTLYDGAKIVISRSHCSFSDDEGHEFKVNLHKALEIEADPAPAPIGYNGSREPDMPGPEPYDFF